MLKILKNKKGFLGDIFSGIQGVFQTITNIMPKPVLFAIFLLLILFLGNMLSYVFYMTGIYCNSADEPVKLDGNIFNNLALIGEVPSIELLNQEAIATNPTDNILVGSCVLQVKKANLTVRKDNTAQQLSTNNVIIGQTITINTTTYLFKGTACSNCLRINGEEYDGINTNFEDYCYGDATRKTDSEKGWWARNFCESNGIETEKYCEMPIGYRYESTTGLFVCQDNTCEGKQSDVWNEKLEGRNAKLLYPELSTGRKKTSKDAIGVACYDLQPKLAVYGINIFDYTLWLFIALISLMFGAYQKYKN